MIKKRDFVKPSKYRRLPLNIILFVLNYKDQTKRRENEDDEDEETEEDEPRNKKMKKPNNEVLFKSS